MHRHTSADVRQGPLLLLVAVYSAQGASPAYVPSNMPTQSAHCPVNQARGCTRHMSDAPSLLGSDAETVNSIKTLQSSTRQTHQVGWTQKRRDLARRNMSTKRAAICDPNRQPFQRIGLFDFCGLTLDLSIIDIPLPTVRAQPVIRKANLGAGEVRAFIGIWAVTHMSWAICLLGKTQTLLLIHVSAEAMIRPTIKCWTGDNTLSPLTCGRQRWLVQRWIAKLLG
ncbi:hypothetical protein TW80_08965 [Loktanella sp. S4079]|nr:hypothetical protein TW80_08965 [Loktanella sp. S4079]